MACGSLRTAASEWENRVISSLSQLFLYTWHCEGVQNMDTKTPRIVNSVESRLRIREELKNSSPCMGLVGSRTSAMSQPSALLLSFVHTLHTDLSCLNDRSVRHTSEPIDGLRSPEISLDSDSSKSLEQIPLTSHHPSCNPTAINVSAP